MYALQSKANALWVMMVLSGCEDMDMDHRASVAAGKGNGPTSETTTLSGSFDNAVAESFFSTLEWELLSQRVFVTRQRARVALFDYIEVFYKAERRHSYLEYASPIDFERKKAVLPLAA